MNGANNMNSVNGLNSYNINISSATNRQNSTKIQSMYSIISFMDILKYSGSNNLNNLRTSSPANLAKNNSKQNGVKNSGDFRYSKDSKDFGNSAVSKIRRYINGKDNVRKFNKSNIKSEFKEAISEILKKDGEGEIKTDISKLLELFGVPQDVMPAFTEFIEYIEFINSNENNSGNDTDTIFTAFDIKNAGFDQINRFLDEFKPGKYSDFFDDTNDANRLDTLPEDIKISIADFYSELHAAYKKSGGARMLSSLDNSHNSGNPKISEMLNISEISDASKSSTQLSGLSELSEKTGDDNNYNDYNVYKDALVNYTAKKLEAYDTTLKNILSELSDSLDLSDKSGIMPEDANAKSMKFELISADSIESGKSGKNQDKPSIFDVVNSMKKISGISRIGNLNQNADINDINTGQSNQNDQYNQNANGNSNNIFGINYLSKNINNFYKNILNSDDNNNIDVFETESDYRILSGITDVRGAIPNTEDTTDSLGDIKMNASDFGKEISKFIVNNANNVINQYNQQEKFEIKMKLFPEELGEIFVKVAYNKGNVSLNVITENKNAEREILNQAANLRESLKSHEFDLSEFDVSSRNGFNYSRNNYNNHDNHNSRNNYNSNQNGYANISRTDLSGDSTVNNSLKDGETKREAAMMNYIRSKRLVYKTI